MTVPCRGALEGAAVGLGRHISSVRQAAPRPRYKTAGDRRAPQQESRLALVDPKSLHVEQVQAHRLPPQGLVHHLNVDHKSDGPPPRFPSELLVKDHPADTGITELVACQQCRDPVIGQRVRPKSSRRYWCSEIHSAPCRGAHSRRNTRSPQPGGHLWNYVNLPLGNYANVHMRSSLRSKLRALVERHRAKGGSPGSSIPEPTTTLSTSSTARTPAARLVQDKRFTRRGSETPEGPEGCPRREPPSAQTPGPIRNRLSRWTSASQDLTHRPSKASWT